MTRVVRGEAVVITREGAKVAELRPLRQHLVATGELIDRRATLPLVDAASLQEDLEAVLDGTL